MLLQAALTRPPSTSRTCRQAWLWASLRCNPASITHRCLAALPLCTSLHMHDARHHAHASENMYGPML